MDRQTVATTTEGGRAGGDGPWALCPVLTAGLEVEGSARPRRPPGPCSHWEVKFPFPPGRQMLLSGQHLSPAL